MLHSVNEKDDDQLSIIWFFLFLLILVAFKFGYNPHVIIWIKYAELSNVYSNYLSGGL